MSDIAQADGGSGVLRPSVPVEPSTVFLSPSCGQSPAKPQKERVAQRLPETAMASSAVVPLAGGKPPTSETAAPVAETGGRRRFLPPNALRFGAAVCCSTVAHMALVIVLALWFFPEMAKPRFTEIEASVLDRPEELINQVLETEVEPTKELALVSASPLATTSGRRPGCPNHVPSRCR